MQCGKVDKLGVWLVGEFVGGIPFIYKKAAGSWGFFLKRERREMIILERERERERVRSGIICRFFLLAQRVFPGSLPLTRERCSIPRMDLGGESEEPHLQGNDGGYTFHVFHGRDVV
jgi:hypothetical protein